MGRKISVCLFSSENVALEVSKKVKYVYGGKKQVLRSSTQLFLRNNYVHVAFALNDLNYNPITVLY